MAIGTCSVCGSTQNVVLHHISYDPEVTIDICRKCHTAIHMNKKNELNPGREAVKQHYGVNYGRIQTYNLNQFGGAGKYLLDKYCKETNRNKSSMLLWTLRFYDKNKNKIQYMKKELKWYKNQDIGIWMKNNF